MYPAFRKYKNSNTYFKIISQNRFEEITFIGDKAFVYVIEAKQYPEFLRIQDMLDNVGDAWEEITEQDYIKQKNSI